jgi:general nucleoside transport system permease protein
MTSDTLLHHDVELPPPPHWSGAAQRVLPPLLAAGLCLLIGLGTLAALGYSVGEVLRTVWEKVLWPQTGPRRLASWSYVLQYATPILLTGLAITVAFRAAVWNIGAQGQYLLGAIAATAVGVHVDAPSPVLIPLVLVGGIVAGAMLAMLAASLNVWRRVPVVLSTLLLNFIVLELLRFLLQGLMREPGGQVKSAPLLDAARLPLVAGTRLHVGFVVALLAAPAIAFLVRHTTFGFRLRVVGENPTAARFAGISVSRVSIATMALSGALAGLAGGIEVSGVTHELHLSANDTAFGFTGIAVALLGRLTATGVVAAAVFFGLLNAGFRALQAEVGVPFVTGQALQGLIVILMLVLTHPRLLSRFTPRPKARAS